MNDNKLFEFFLEMQAQIKMFHWTTMKYSEHKALDELSKSLDNNIDDFIEIYISKYDKQPIKKYNISIKIQNKNIIGYLQSKEKYIIKIRNKYFINIPQLQNILDDIIGYIEKTIYLCRLG